MIAHGVNGNGSWEILAVEPMFDESEYSWREFFHKLKKRRLQGMSLCVSDAQAGYTGRGEKRAPGSFLAALQDPFYAEHPGQGPAQGINGVLPPI